MPHEQCPLYATAFQMVVPDRFVKNIICQQLDEDKKYTRNQYIQPEVSDDGDKRAEKERYQEQKQKRTFNHPDDADFKTFLNKKDFFSDENKGEYPRKIRNQQRQIQVHAVLEIKMIA